MLSTMIGGGALSLPYAFKLCGLSAGLPLLLASALASDFAMYALCAASRRTGTATLAELAREAQGPRLEAAVIASLFMLCAFVSVAYARLLRDLLALFLEPLELEPRVVDWCLIAAATLVLFPLSLHRELHRLRFAAFTSFSGAICVALLFMYRAAPEVRAAFTSGREHGARLMSALMLPGPGLNLWGALEALPIMVLLFLCQFNVLSIHARLHNPTRARLKCLIHVAVSVTFVFYVCFGVAGAVVCSSAPLAIAQDALSCLAATGSSSDILLACAGGAFAVSILLNTPALIIPLRDSLQLFGTKLVSISTRRQAHEDGHYRAAKPSERTKLADIHEREEEIEASFTLSKDHTDEEPPADQEAGATLSTMLHAILTAAIVVFVVVAALHVPGVASVWAVAGSCVGLFVRQRYKSQNCIATSLSQVAFILPCALYLLVRGDKAGSAARLRKFISATLVLLSSALAVVCTCRNAKSILFPTNT